MHRLTSVYIYSFLTGITTWFFLHVQKSYGEGVPTFDQIALVNSWNYFKYYFVFFGIFTISIIFYKKLSYLFYALLALIAIYFSIKLQIIHFNKISIIAIFFYMIVAYYHCYFLYKENQEPYYFYNKNINQLVRTDLIYPIDCQIEFNNKKTKHNAKIVSWSKNGLFIYKEDGFSLSGSVLSVTVEKFGRFFSFYGTIITTTKDSKGVGIKLELEPEQDIFGWLDLYKILRDRGIGPEYVL